MNTLVALNITNKAFAGRTVIRNVALHIQRNQIVSIVGASGCGKSTLLRIAGGLDTDYEGEVLLSGQTPSLNGHEVGFVFQEPRLLPWLTVAENVGFEIGKAARTEPAVKALLSEVGLEKFLQAYPKELSGGMAQRVAIARGLFSNPSLLLLDEPFSAVDALTKTRLQDLLLSLSAKHHSTLLLVTHDIKEAVYLSDRVIVLSSNPGTIAGDISIALSRPRNRQDPQLLAYEVEVLAHLHQQRTAAL